VFEDISAPDGRSGTHKSGPGTSGFEGKVGALNRCNQDAAWGLDRSHLPPDKVGTQLILMQKLLASLPDNPAQVVSAALAQDYEDLVRQPHQPRLHASVLDLGKICIFFKKKPLLRP
jgi:hypothetical protein